MISFTGRYAFLSNFYIEPDGTHVEAEFQAQKTLLPTERARILSAGSPGKAKRIGKNPSLTTLRPDWEDIKIVRMHALVEQKFTDHVRLARALLETGDNKLVECNTWGDDIWGMVKNGSGEWTGQNLLGEILMVVRHDLYNALATVQR